MKTKQSDYRFTGIILGLITLVASTAYLVYRFLNDKNYAEKWKDYDDCGLA